MGRCNLMTCRGAACLCVFNLALLAGLLLFPAASTAQVAGLDDNGNWQYREVYWRNAAGLPSDREFAGEITAQYNWAYGMTVVGTNVRVPGTSDFYCAVALYGTGYLDAMATIGPLPGPVIWDSGPFHVAAGLPDGRLIVWLTAPGESPREMLFSTDYRPGSAFDVIAYTPAVANTNWGEWWVTAAFQTNSGDYSVVVDNQDGNGRPLGTLDLLGVPGYLESVSYADTVVNNQGVPLMLLSVARDDLLDLGNNEHLLSQAAWYDQNEGWRVQNLRNSGLDNGEVYCSADDEVQMYVAYDESDPYSLTSGIQKFNYISANNPAGGFIQGGFDNLPLAGNAGLWSYFKSAMTQPPMIAASDGLDVWLGVYSPRAGRIGNELGYVFFTLFQGEGRQGTDNELVPLFPIEGIGATAHWSSGKPELFWVQNGSPSNAGGQLYRMQYAPVTR